MYSGSYSLRSYVNTHISYYTIRLDYITKYCECTIYVLFIYAQFKLFSLWHRTYILHPFAHLSIKRVKTTHLNIFVSGTNLIFYLACACSFILIHAYQRHDFSQHHYPFLLVINQLFFSSCLNSTLFFSFFLFLLT